MTEHIFADKPDGHIYLEWNYTHWEVIQNMPCNTDSFDEFNDYIKNLDQSLLPKPKRQLQDVIKFNWGSSGILTGDIRKISCSIGSDGKSRYLTYDVQANGHNRYVHEQDILGL